MEEIISFLSANDKVVTAWTAIAALFVSLVSIIIAVSNFVMQRRHNRKSVQPIGHISVGNYENEIFVRLWNHGVGPMIVRAVTVNKAGEQQTKHSIIDFMPDLPKNRPWTTYVPDISGRAISANDSVTLIALKGNTRDKGFTSARQLVRKALSSLSIKVDHENIYGEKMKPALRNLDWFAEN